MRPEYVNGFMLETNPVTNEVTLTLFSNYNEYDNEDKPCPKRDGIGSFVLPGYTAGLLFDALSGVRQTDQSDNP